MSNRGKGDQRDQSVICHLVENRQSFVVRMCTQLCEFGSSCSVGLWPGQGELVPSHLIIRSPRGHSDSQASNMDPGVATVTTEGAKGDGEVVLEHGRGLLRVSSHLSFVPILTLKGYSKRFLDQ